MEDKTVEREGTELRPELKVQNSGDSAHENANHLFAAHGHPGAFTTSFTLRNPIPTLGAIPRRESSSMESIAAAIDCGYLTNQITSSNMETSNGSTFGDYELMELLHKELVNGTENKDFSREDRLYENSHIVLLDGVIYEDNETLDGSPPSKRPRSMDNNSPSMSIDIQNSRCSSSQNLTTNFYSYKVEHLTEDDSHKSVKKRKRDSLNSVATENFSNSSVESSQCGDEVGGDEDVGDDEEDYYDDEDASSVRTGYSTSNMTSLLTTTSSIDNTENSSHSNLDSHLSQLSSTIHSSSNEDDDETQSNNTSQAVQPVRRRHRKYYDRRVKPFPRVLKRDIRRSYANMLINVMNSYDVELIVKFFTHFCLANCYLFDDSSEAMQIQPNSMISSLLNGPMGALNGANAGGAARNNNTSLRQVQGPEHIALHMLRGMDLVPDCVVQLKQASIHQYLNTTGSKIVCKVTMSGTKLFKYAFTSGSVMLQSILHQTEAQEQVFNVLQMVLGESAAAKLSMEDISQYFQKIMVSEPVDVSFAATITMYLDEEHRIYRLDFTN